MSTILYIRRKVFCATQQEMAVIAKVTQATWSRWEAGEHSPSLEHLLRIRAEAQRRGLPWHDRWLFEPEAA